MNKQIVVYSYDVILSTIKKQWTRHTQNMVKYQIYYTEFKKSQIWNSTHGMIYMKL